MNFFNSDDLMDFLLWVDRYITPEDFIKEIKELCQDAFDNDDQYLHYVVDDLFANNKLNLHNLSERFHRSTIAPWVNMMYNKWDSQR